MLSVPHLVIIFLVALIVFGPEKLPELARTFGKAMTEFKRATGDLRAGFEEHMRELERETTIREAQKKPAETVKAPALVVEHSATNPSSLETAATATNSTTTESAEPATVASEIQQAIPEKAANGDV
ncbi:MAG TPA: twin-arginine translocase TatA/TatE family subunit [Candidatus Acidoferrales bacterium]|nr:twin-arginine translocase TatA/TatE family subunit [Candidatus Acidoferrales bacterium]